MNKKKNIFNMGLVIFGLAIFSLMAILVVCNKIRVFDDFIYSIVSSIKCKNVTVFAMILSMFSSTYFLVISIIVILIVAKDKKKAFYICLNIGLCCLINQVLKLCFGRNRPVDINIVLEKGFSFPSGHSMVSLAYYGMYIYLLNKVNSEKWIKIFCSFLLILFILLIGISRIYLGVHFASDVLGGFSLSITYLVLYIKLIYEKRVTS